MTSPARYVSLPRSGERPYVQQYILILADTGVRVGEITGLAFRVKPVADQWSLKTPSTGLISAGLMRRECATVTECTTPSSDFCQNSKKPCSSGKSGQRS